MHATKYEYANTTPLPPASGAPESSNLLAPLRSASCKWCGGGGSVVRRAGKRNRPLRGDSRRSPKLGH
ncbi:GM13984 [Drosophila sechellia]|uniref:GM13984 n=1 Tax=Drosophila sechellia TaxID=7238 RepID=B4HU48_DROSE|nr:GM13984 [Drosophila sechellia]